MGVLSKKDILKNIKTGGLSFDPDIDAFQLQPHSVDLRLGHTFYIGKTWEVTQKGRASMSVDYLNNIANKNYFEIIELNPGQYFDILPKEYVIAQTMETINIKNLKIMGVLFPRSSFNRRGLSVDISGVIDSGYSGTLMIPIQNNTASQTIRIYPGERICQVMFEELTTKLAPDDAPVSTSDMSTESSNTFTKLEREEEKKYILEGRVGDLKKDYNL